MGLEQIYTEVVSEHAREPENKPPLDCETCSLKGHNPSCGDEITLHLDVEDGVVKDAAFSGIGCAISQASTDIMSARGPGKSVAEARALAQKFSGMIKGDITDEAELEPLEEALALKDIRHMPARVKCAVLAWHTLDMALDDKENTQKK